MQLELQNSNRPATRRKYIRKNTLWDIINSDFRWK